MNSRSNDPLFNALNSKSRYSIPIAGRGSNFFSSKLDMEYFKLSYGQRFLAFFICLIMGILSFFYALMNILGASISPRKFSIPYAFSNMCFFMAIGFIKGFKSYFRDLNSPSKRIFTYTFLTTTFMTFYMAAKTHYIVSLFLMIAQIASFIAFAVSFVPGGTTGLTSMVKVFIKR